jgi:hypothetical protein
MAFLVCLNVEYLATTAPKYFAEIYLLMNCDQCMQKQQSFGRSPNAKRSQVRNVAQRPQHIAATLVASSFLKFDGALSII